jgi:hypothetical protein
MTVHITLFAWFTCGLAFFLSGLVLGVWVRRVPTISTYRSSLPLPRDMAVTLSGDQTFADLVRQCKKVR